MGLVRPKEPARPAADAGMVLQWRPRLCPLERQHRRAIGLEEICGYFHLGHAASVADNPVAASGSPTAVQLVPDAPLNLSYMFGLAAVPPGFGTVRDIVSAPGGVRLTDIAGKQVFAACDLSFITG